MRPIFRGFYINWFGIGPLHFISSCSDFGFEFSAWLLVDSPTRQVGELPTLRLGESGSRLLNVNTLSRRVVDSPTRRVGDSPSRRFRESVTPRLTDLGSRYGESGSRYSNFLNLSSIYRTLKAKPAL